MSLMEEKSLVLQRQPDCLKSNAAAAEMPAPCHPREQHGLPGSGGSKAWYYGGFEPRQSIKRVLLAYYWRTWPFAAEGSDRKLNLYSGKKIKPGMSLEGLCLWYTNMKTLVSEWASLKKGSSHGCPLPSSSSPSLTPLSPQKLLAPKAKCVFHLTFWLSKPIDCFRCRSQLPGRYKWRQSDETWHNNSSYDIDCALLH